jgi:hypothetical protein
VSLAVREQATLGPGESFLADNTLAANGTLVVQVLATPAGVLATDIRLSAGIDSGDGSRSLLPADLDGLTFTPPADAFGSFALEVVATATERDGGTPAQAIAAGPLHVEVGDALDAADVIADFGATDVLDLGALLSTLGGTPPSADDYVGMVQAGIAVEVRVDHNGGAAGDTNTLLATIQNQTAAQVRTQTDFG